MSRRTARQINRGYSPPNRLINVIALIFAIPTFYLTEYLLKDSSYVQAVKNMPQLELLAAEGAIPFFLQLMPGFIAAAIVYFIVLMICRIIVNKFLS